MSDNQLPMTIEVKVNIPSYEYDIHSLVKAFYPRAEVNVQVKEKFDTDCPLKLDVRFADGGVRVELFGKRHVCHGVLLRTAKGAVEKRSEGSFQTADLSGAVRLQRTDAAVGNADRYPPDENSDGDARGR